MSEHLTRDIVRDIARASHNRSGENVHVKKKFNLDQEYLELNKVLDTAIGGRVIGASLKDIVKTHSTPEGGRIAFALKQDFVARTIGHVVAIPGFHIPFLTFRYIFKNPSPELVNDLYERWKDVPWKGDLLVRVGHTSVRGDLERLFLLNRDWIKGKHVTFKFMWALVARSAFVPLVVASSLMAKVLRTDHYNPLTHTVNVFQPVLSVGMHEIGHAQFWDEKHPFKGALYMLSPFVVPFAKSFTEWKATANAMKRFKDDPERREATKILEPAWATYLISDTAGIVMPYIPEPIRKLTSGLAMTVGALASGHILSRLPYPGKRRRFEYVFEGKEPGKELGPQQVRYAFARAPVP